MHVRPQYITQDEARRAQAVARVMLAALQEIRAGWSRHMEGDEESRQIALLDNAIAAAEAAGIKGED